MLPEFKRNRNAYETIYKVGEVEIKPDAVCDCGDPATVLATFQIILPPGAEAETDRDGIGALLLCAFCAYELQRLDMKCKETTHYMPLENALLQAKYKDYGEPAERNEYRMSAKWKKIIKWMSEKGTVTGVDVYREFRMKPDAVHSQLNALAKKGILKKFGSAMKYVYEVA